MINVEETTPVLNVLSCTRLHAACARTDIFRDPCDNVVYPEFPFVLKHAITMFNDGVQDLEL
jgi:hypothetical protein